MHVFYVPTTMLRNLFLKKTNNLKKLYYVIKQIKTIATYIHVMVIYSIQTKIEVPP